MHNKKLKYSELNESRMRRILVVYYSQSGQLKQIVDRFLIPFRDIEIEYLVVDPKYPFPFPWDTRSFFDVMPASVLEEEIEINTPKFRHDKYDLVSQGNIIDTIYKFYASPLESVSRYTFEPLGRYKQVLLFLVCYEFLKPRLTIDRL